MSRIKEIIVEPVKIYTGSNFKVKIKIPKYMTCVEMKKINCKKAKEFIVAQVKGA